MRALSLFLADLAARTAARADADHRTNRPIDTPLEPLRPGAFAAWMARERAADQAAEAGPRGSLAGPAGAGDAHPHGRVRSRPDVRRA
jgi:hypothetical protein